MAGSTCSGEADTRALETTLTLTLCRAHISHYDGSFGMAVRRCFSFSDVNTTVELVDGRGCPDPVIMSQFSYDSLTGTAQPPRPNSSPCSSSQRATSQFSV